MKFPILTISEMNDAINYHEYHCSSLWVGIIALIGAQYRVILTIIEANDFVAEVCLKHYYINRVIYQQIPLHV